MVGTCIHCGRSERVLGGADNPGACVDLHGCVDAAEPAEPRITPAMVRRLRRRILDATVPSEWRDNAPAAIAAWTVAENKRTK